MEPNLRAHADICSAIENKRARSFLISHMTASSQPMPNSPAMSLLVLPAFTDNYIWLLHDDMQAVVIDPGEAVPVEEGLQSQGLRLAGILVTHHHSDHVGGVDALRGVLQGAVFGPARERIPEPFTPLHGGDTASLMGLDFQVIDVPGHTAGHIAYFLPRGAHGAPILFCGDTLFSAGCGRLFEGSPAQMQASLATLDALPADTRVCCAHEYTLANLRFAAAVEPDNPVIAQHLIWCKTQRAHGGFTLPSSLALERQINPFLRLSQPDVVRAARQRRPWAHGDAEVLATLREWKNEFV